MSIVKSNGSRTLPKMISDFFDTNDFFSFPDINKYVNNKLPAVNIRENDTQYIVELAVPGMKKEDFRIAVDDDLLTIQAEQKSEKEETKDNYRRQEFNYNSFSRCFTLPENAVVEKITAGYENGLLSLEIPKAAGTPPEKKHEIPLS